MTDSTASYQLRVFEDRRNASAKAKEALLKKVQAVSTNADPQAAAMRAAMQEKEAARRTAAAEKTARKAARDARYAGRKARQR